MKRGPKPPPDDSPLKFARTGDDVEDFERFCAEYVRVERKAPMVLRPWQVDIVRMIWGDPRPKMAALAIGRGNAKSSLAAALCTYLLYVEDDFSIDLLAYDERQAHIVGGICAKMIGRHPALDARARIFKDRIVRGGSELYWLPATAAALEGRLPDWTVCDEGGRIDREVFEVAAFSASKKPHAQLLLLGTPGPREDSVLAEFRAHSLEHPEDMSQRYMEFSADRWRDHPADCDDHDGGPGCLSAANPALGDWLTRESVLSTLPPKMTENHWRRVRLVQFWATGVEDPFVTRDVWDGLGTGRGVPDGAEVVLAFDGSHSGGTTALLVGTVGHRPHFDRVQVWANPGDPDWRVSVLEAEQAIRDACQRWKVAEVVADPFRWTRSLQILAAEGIPVVEFPHSNAARMTAATTDLHRAIVNGQMSHSGDETLAKHVMAATVVESDRGLKLSKVSRSRHAPHIDLAACLVMAHSRATYLATRPQKKHRTMGFAS